MTIFTATALAAFIAANNCVPPKAADVMIGIAQTESGLNSLSLHDNTANVSFTPSSKEEAVHLAQALIAHHHDLDLGLGNVNIRNFSWLGLTVETAFDACQNIAAASRVLFVRYNGNPPNTQKIAYAQRVTANIGVAETTSTAPAATAVASQMASSMEDIPGQVGETLISGDN